MLGPDDLVFSSVPVSHYPLLERLAPARDAGFRGISLQPHDVWHLEQEGMSAKEVSQRIADHGLKIVEIDCIGHWLPQHKTADAGDFTEHLRNLVAEKIIPTAAEVGARSIAVVEMHGVRPSIDEGASALAAICKPATEHGLIVHVEFAPFGGIPDLQLAWEIVQASGYPNAGLTIDSWHFTRSGSTLEQLGKIPGERIGTVQINDGPLAATGDPLAECMTSRRLPGDGEFDLIGLIQTLDKIGSAVPIGIEVFSQEQQSQTLAEIAQNWASSARHILKQAREER